MKHAGKYLVCTYPDLFPGYGAQPITPHPIKGEYVELFGEFGAVLELWRRLKLIDRLQEGDVTWQVLTLEQLENGQAA